MDAASSSLTPGEAANAVLASAEPVVRAPLIVNLGLGVDSVAMLIGLHARGERPDLVIFADTGSEKPATYDYRAVIDEWLARVGFPAVTVVRRPSVRAGYKSLEENCIANETLPSLAFGRKSCSLKWKAEAMDRVILGVGGAAKCEGWAPALAALARGVKPVKCIGYDNGPKDSRRAVGTGEDEHFVYRYPLREWGWDREECMRQIIGAGLPVPVKSACFFCPASKPWELLVLASRHPELLLRALHMEDVARAGKHGLRTIAGLWRKQSWRGWCEAEGITRGDAIVMSREELEARIAVAKPAMESAAGCPL